MDDEYVVDAMVMKLQKKVTHSRMEAQGKLHRCTEMYQIVNLYPSNNIC